MNIMVTVHLEHTTQVVLERHNAKYLSCSQVSCYVYTAASD